MELALEAKRNKDFTQAFELYQQELDNNGLTVELLDGISKIYYLLHNTNAAITFNLAARHLGLYFNNEAFKQGDEGLLFALDQIPEEVKSKFPHPVGATLYFNYESIVDMGHATLDNENTYEQFSDFETHAEIYYASILDDGSYEETLRKHNITDEEHRTYNEEYYVGFGFEFIIDSIEWDKIENPNVFEIYMTE